MVAGRYNDFTTGGGLGTRFCASTEFPQSDPAFGLAVPRRDDLIDDAVHLT